MHKTKRVANRDRIQKELVQFKRKYWFAKLIQGLLIFIGSGIALALIAVGIEYAAWLEPGQRKTLFILTVIIEIGLLAYYIGWPGLQIILKGRALSNRQAASIIGQSLHGVDDVLENYLELQDLKSSSALVEASLGQKGEALSRYDFLKAVKWSSLRPFLSFLLIPALLLGFLLTDKGRDAIIQGGERLVNYSVAYERSLPFEISLENELFVEEGQDLVLYIKTQGDVSPEELYIASEQGEQELERVAPSRFKKVFRNCVEDLDFHFMYDEISSSTYSLRVIRRPVLGRVHIRVTPPSYTGIDVYDIDNTRVVQVPEGSKLDINYVFKNVDELQLFVAGSDIDTVRVRNGQALDLVANESMRIGAYADKLLLNDLDVEVLKDNAPTLEINVDSVENGLIFDINANDDYKILAAKSVIVFEDRTEVAQKLTPNQAILKSTLFYSYEQLESMKLIRVSVRDVKQQRSKEIDLSAFKERERTTEQLLSEAGESIEALKEKDPEPSGEKKQKASSEKSLKEKKEKAEKIEETAKKLSKADSTQFERFEQLSEDIKELLEKMDKDIPKSQKEMLEKKLEEQIEQLEQEWMILKAIDQLKQLDDSLETKPFVDEKQMEKIQETADELKEKLDQEKKENVDWKKYEDLKKQNSELKKKTDLGDNDSPEEEGEKEEQENKDEADQKEKDGKKEPSSKSPKEQMKQDSDALKQQLSQMSATMMMETMQKNIELLRRLEIRSLKASTKQEEVYLSTVEQNEYSRALVLAQKEITQSARAVLDSLSALLITDPMLGQVLTENKALLVDHIDEMEGLAEMSQSNRVSSQRYLQYSLNDLASILYDILKSENDAMQNMMAGNKACNKPKPGKGKKGSVSKKQKELGEKMGQMKKPGKGKSGKQTIGQGELLELIKGQEEAINQYKQEGGSKAGDGDVLDEMNKQLDDLINNNIDKAIERNKSIEEKLIAIEKSENEKKEQKEDRQSKESKIDYDVMRETALEDYLRTNQRNTGVVNLPALKNYFTGKWIIINQK